MRQPSPAELPTADLVKQLASQSVELVEKEAELAQSELRQEAEQEEGVAERVGVAVVFALVALTGLLFAAFFGLERLVPDWAASLIIAGFGTIASAVVAILTRQRVKLLPRTRSGLRESFAWLKKRLR